MAKNYGDQRVAMNFFYASLGSPEEEEWKGRYVTASQIRMRMGAFAPKLARCNESWSAKRMLP